MKEVCLVLQLPKKIEKKMPEMHIDRKMNRCDFKYLYFDKVASCN